MDTTRHLAATPDLSLMCRLRAAVQWLETPRPFASVAVDLAELMSVVGPVVVGVEPPRRIGDTADPLRVLATLHAYYVADPQTAAADPTLLREALDSARHAYTAAFCAPAVA